MKDVSILVVSYNTKDLTLECLRSVYEQTKDILFEIIVVDNCSSDGSALAISKEFPDVVLIKSQSNLGFAAANNLGAKKAEGRYLLLLNPDTVVLEGAVQKLYNFAENSPQNLVYGGRTLFGNMSLNPTSCWKQQNLWSLVCYSLGLNTVFKNIMFFNPEGYGGWKRDSTRTVDIISGCFLLIDRKLWDSLGGFDPKFFMYAEDADLCLRAIKKGAVPVIFPDATIIHHGGASEKIRADKIVRLFKAKQALIIQHWSPVKRRIGMGLFSYGVRLRTIGNKILSILFPNKYRVQAKNWQEVWKRREEWQNPGL